MNTVRSTTISMLLFSAAALCGCGDGGETGTAAATTHSLGGTISGLEGSGLMLANTDGSTIMPAPKATVFAFGASFASGESYAVTVKAQPTNPSQTCSVTHGSGMITGNVSSIAVSCAATNYRVSGTVSGLSGTGLIIGSANGGAAAIVANGHFQLPQSLATGSMYEVVVLTAPNSPAQGCSVHNAAGTIATSSISNVAVTCANASEELVIADGQGKSAAYLIDPSTGTPVPSGTPTGLMAAVAIGATDPAGKFLFVPGDPAAGSLSAYTADPATGRMVPVTGSPFASAATAAPVVDPSGLYLYAGAASGALAYTIDPGTGALSPITGSPFAGLSGGTPPGAVGCPCIAGAKFLYYTQARGAGSVAIADFGINAGSGALAAAAAAGPTATGDTFAAIDPAGRVFFMLSGGMLQTYAVNAVTGALTNPQTTQAPAAMGGFGYGVAVDPSGKFAYVLGEPGGSIYGFSVNATSGALTPLSPATVVTGTQPLQMRFDLTGRYLYVTSNAPQAIWAYAFDSASGALTPVGDGQFATAVAPTGLVVTSLP